MGFFTPIHNTVFESLKLIDVYSLNTLANLTINNILFGILNKNFSEVNEFYSIILLFNFVIFNLIQLNFI
jgi:hypothetical protein